MRKKILVSTILLIAVMLIGIFAYTIFNSQSIEIKSLTKTISAIQTQTNGNKPIISWNNVVRDTNGKVVYNSTSYDDPVTSTGSSYAISMMSNTTVTTLANYLGVSNDTTPLVTWNALPTEITTNGLARAQATATYGWCTTSSGQSQYVVWTYTWTCQTANENQVQCEGLYYTSGTNSLVCATTFTGGAVNVLVGYTLTATLNETMPCG